MIDILVDGTAFCNDSQRGIQRYYRELFTRAEKNQNIAYFFDEEPVSFFKGTNDPTVTVRREHKEHKPKQLVKRTYSALRKRISPTQLPQAKIFQSTFFTRSPNPSLNEVLTVYDMVPEVMPYSFPGSAEKVAAVKKACILNATKIIAISNTTADSILKLYPQVEGRVEVVYLGADHIKETKQGHGDTEISTPYCLFVGARHGYKNFQLVLEAINQKGWPSDLKLVVAGAPLNDLEKTLIRYHGLHDKIISLGVVSDEHLSQLYTKASCFIFPSLMEGFGFPILEAQACKTPLICSDIPIFHEVSGDHAFFFDPMSSTDLVNTINQALGSNQHLDEGFLNVDKFKWDDCASQTLKVWDVAVST
ncbi:glycosyltransferase family 1 protein [Rubellicoccus peritrichatus]|uniref:Glycosyltransferase family 1 protein n=1 Tax=Rubellicoccus peritrichatus TaxID=3080537 RepID=A0AAQ3L991_9BACT|nr:glycosyltransferase family 1 protein [Puniceicoccus sp. CR14]WOO41436.1 glycosyltransferase family 1 protein [Puniceicoccus sp. CR14]